MEYYVRKKSGNIEDWQPGKIAKAVGMAAGRICTTLSDDEIGQIIGYVEVEVAKRCDNVVPVETVHLYVEAALREVRPDVAASYMDYRNGVKKNAEMNAKILTLLSYPQNGLRNLKFWKLPSLENIF